MVIGPAWLTMVSAEFRLLRVSSFRKLIAFALFLFKDVVQAQEGDFYGSWITPEITGGERGFKGGAGTWGW